MGWDVTDFGRGTSTVRGGGTPAVEFTREGFVEPLAGEPMALTVLIDGRSHPAFDGPLRLTAGQSITVPRGLHHRFWGEASEVLVAEVSESNDDEGDNFFLDTADRFTRIEEDAAPHRPLWNEGPR